MTAVVKDMMTAKVIWVRKDTPFAAMAAALRQYRVSAFPVLNEAGQVVGVVSEADLLTKEALGGGAEEVPGMITGLTRRREYKKALGTTAGELMTSPAITISPNATAERAARLMYLHRVKRLPVVDAHRHLVGIISRADVLSVFGRADEDIRQEILADVLLTGVLTHPDTIGVSVKDGVVTLTGVAEPRETGREFARRVRHLEGVVAVRDCLRYVPAGPDGYDAAVSFPVD